MRRAMAPPGPRMSWSVEVLLMGCGDCTPDVRKMFAAEKSEFFSDMRLEDPRHPFQFQMLAAGHDVYRPAVPSRQLQPGPRGIFRSLLLIHQHLNTLQIARLKIVAVLSER